MPSFKEWLQDHGYTPADEWELNEYRQEYADEMSDSACLYYQTLADLVD